MDQERSGITPQVMAQWRARLLDLRSYVSALFAIFGVIVTITGIVTPADQLTKASGLNLSLWTGIAMLLLSGVFFVWLLAAPPEVPEPADAAKVADEAEEAAT